MGAKQDHDACNHVCAKLRRPHTTTCSNSARTGPESALKGPMSGATQSLAVDLKGQEFGQRKTSAYLFDCKRQPWGDNSSFKISSILILFLFIENACRDRMLIVLIVQLLNSF
jgi:hypothetical protein